MLISTLVLLLLLFVANIKSFRAKLRPCRRGEDTFGQWIPMEVARKQGIDRYFYGNESIEELQYFDKFWQPVSCSYRRFSVQTLRLIVQSITSKTKAQQVEILFVGDSGTR